MQNLIRYEMAFKEAMEISQKIKALSGTLTGLGYPLSEAEFTALTDGFPALYEHIHHHIERCKKELVSA